MIRTTSANPFFFCNWTYNEFWFCFHSQWLKEAMRENEPDSCLIFLVGAKNDLLVSMLWITWVFWIFIILALIHFALKPIEEKQRTEKDAIKIATEMQAEFWAVSSKTGKTQKHTLVWILREYNYNATMKSRKPFPLFEGENVEGFFFRVAALAFERCVLKDLENRTPASIGRGDSISKQWVKS